MKEQVKYSLDIGRRAPLHQGHLACIIESIKKGLIPIIFNGSANGVYNRNYDPIKSPLTDKQQIDQVKAAMRHPAVLAAMEQSDKFQKRISELGLDPNKPYYIIQLPDVSNDELWVSEVFRLAKEQIPSLTMDQLSYHYFPKEADNITKGDGTVINGLDGYRGIFQQRGSHAVPSETAAINAIGKEVFNIDNIGSISATPLRTTNVDSDNFRALPAGEVIAVQAKLARLQNLRRNSLDFLVGIPVTMRDLTILRLFEDHGITEEHFAGISSKKNIDERIKQLDSRIKELVDGIKKVNGAAIDKVADLARKGLNKGVMITPIPFEVRNKLNTLKVPNTIRDIRLAVIYSYASFAKFREPLTNKILEAQSIEQIDIAIAETVKDSGKDFSSYLDRIVYEQVKNTCNLSSGVNSGRSY